MLAFSLDYGIETESWYALLALRTRDSMSAIGSVMVMGSRALPHPGFAGRSGGPLPSRRSAPGDL